MPLPLLVRIACLLALVSGPAFAQDAAKASRFYEDAQKRFDSKDIAGAIIQLKNALQADKNQLPVQLLLGRVLMADGQVVAAEIAFTEALRMGVDRAEVVLPLGQALMAQGKQQLLLQQPRMAPAGLPNSVRQRLLLLRATAYMDLGDDANALQSIQESRAIAPDAADTWWAEVPLRLRARQFKEAMAAADSALKLAPGVAESHYQRGSILHVRGNVGGAIAAYSKALELDPNHVEARIGRAGLYLDSNRDADARADLNEARKRSPREPRAAYMLAVLAERTGDRPAAKAALASVTNLLDPVPPDFIRYRPQLLLVNGLAHFGLQEWGKAKPPLEMFYRVQPSTPVSKVLARLYVQENNVDRAIDVLESYTHANPRDSQALTQLASAYVLKGRAAKATQLMQEALKNNDAPEYHTALGMALVQSGDSDAARQQLLTAFKRDPSQLPAALALVSLYLKSNQPQQASQIADQLLKQHPGNAMLLNLAGVAKAQSGELGKARQLFEASQAASPNEIGPQLGLARLDIADRAFDSATKRLNALLKIDDRNTEVLFDLAIAQERQGKADASLRTLERAVELAGKNDLRPNFALVDLHLRQQRPGPALEAAKTLLGKAPEDLAALQTYARVQLANGDATGARQTLINATRRAGFDATKLVELAAMQVSAGDLDGASYSLDKAFSSNKELVPAQVLMATVHIRRGEHDKAEAMARTLIKTQPKQAVGYQLLGDVASSRGQRAQAVDAYRQAFLVQPNTHTVLPLVVTLSAMDKPAEARSTAEAWLKTHPKDFSVQKALADSAARAGDMPRARSAYEAATRLRPDDAEVLNNLANIQLLLKDVQGAASNAQKALVLAPGNPLYIDTLGWAQFQSGQVDSALIRLRDARLRAPNNPDIRFHLAAVLARTGRSSEAREELTAALRDGGSFDSRTAAKALLDTLK